MMRTGTKRIDRAMKRLLVLASVVAVGASWTEPASAQSGLNPALTNLAVNTWTRLSPRVLDPNGADVTSAGFPINGYSGMVYDPEHRAIIMFGGGGHGTRRGNDVWMYDTATNTWQQQYTPDPESEYPYAEGSPSPMSMSTYCQSTDPLVCNPTAAWLPRGTTRTKRPWTAHSYDQMAWDGYNHKYFFFGPNFIFGDGVDYYGVPDAFHYDVGTKNWTYLGAPDLYHQTSAAEYDPVNRVIVCVGPYSWAKPGYKWMGTPKTFHFNAVTKTWVRKADPPAGFGGCNMVWDSIDHVMLLYGQDWPMASTLWAYDAATDQWSLKNPLPDPIYGLPGAASPHAAFDSNNGVLLIWGESDTGGFIPSWAYDVRTNRWKKMNPVTGEPATRGGVGANLVYDPVNNVFFLNRFGGDSGNPGGMIGELGELWVYRYGTTVLPVDTSVPAAVTDLRPR